MDITPFIRELLFQHDCVTIYGFGGFIGNYTPARIDRNTSTLYPPVKQISFNRNLNHNDGLLAGRISEAFKLNYGDARALIEEFVVSVRKRLDRGEKVIFDSIGSFTRNNEGNVQFEPAPDVNYLLDSYGLEAFKYEQIEGYDVRRRISSYPARKPGTPTTFRKVLWRAAVIIPLAGLFIAVPLKTNLFKGRIEKSDLNPLASAEFENSRKDAEVKTVPEVTEASTAAVDQPARDAETGTNSDIPVISPLGSSDSQATYLIITGSFRSKQNAESQADMLRKNGYDPEIISGPNGFYRVSAVSCSSLGSAIEKRNAITESFPGSWVKKN
jgi:nucleoid DNA-binding protein